MNKPIKYGMHIRLKHCATNLLLKSVPKNYSHPGSSNQQIVGADAIPDADTLWLVKGPDELDENYPKGQIIKNGDVIRLEHVATRRNLHSHDRRSPLTNQQEVTACGANGKADANDNWRVELGGPGEWMSGSPMRLEFQNTGTVLHSHTGYAHPGFTAGLQEVTALPRGDSNDMWQAELPRKSRVHTKLSKSTVRRYRRSLKVQKNRHAISVFISHSSADSDLAKAIAKFLQASLSLSASAIRCTSVPGYKLPIGSNVDARLKKEVNDSAVLVGLVTPASSKSAYVLFELGARWGRGTFLAPLLARGGKIRAPLSSLNALRATIRQDLFQFVRDLSKQLGAPISSPEHYDDELGVVVRLAK